MGSILYIALAWLLLALCSLLPAQQAFADSAEVPAGLPEKQCSSDLVRNITTLIDTGDAGQNVGSGVLYKDNFSTAHARVVCNCPNESYSLSGVTYSAYYALPDNGQAGNIWAILNESLQLRLQLAIYGAPGTGYMELPFERFSSFTQDCNSTTNLFQDSGGATGSFDVKITKGILGEARYSGILARLYRSYGNIPDRAFPIAEYYVDLTVKSSAECSFEGGEVFTVDLGSVPRQILKDGAPPTGYTPKPLNVTIESTNLVQTPTQLEYFFKGVGSPNAEGPYLATSNPGVVIGMTDDAGNPIGLGSTNSVLRPFQNGQSSMDLRFYPARTPGYSDPIEPGPFSATAIVTVTLP